MKFLLASFLALAFISCNHSAPDSKTLTIDSTILRVSDNKDIFGNWTMCAISSGGFIYQGNTCKIIHFDYNGKGFVETGALNPERFSWKLSKSNLKIFYNLYSGTTTFPDTNYFASFDQEKGRIILTLRNKDASHFLSKSTQ